MKNSLEKTWRQWYYSHFSGVLNNRSLATDNTCFQWKMENGWIAISNWLYRISLNNLKLGFVRKFRNIFLKFPFLNREYEIKIENWEVEYEMTK